MAECSLSPAALRQRRYRQRRKRGALTAAADVPALLVEAIAERGLLPNGDSSNPRRLGAALVAIAEKWSKGENN